MKLIKKFFLSIFIFIGTAVLLLFIFDYEYILKGVWVTYLHGHSSVFINDHKYFDNRIIENSPDVTPWPLSEEYNLVHPTDSLKAMNRELGTVAFLIIKNDSILYENYAPGYGTDSKTNSFSMAKSIVTALLGRAIKEGYIKSLEQPVSAFYPQFDDSLTVGDLASMASGLNWQEDYSNPFSMTARAYFDENIHPLILELEVVEEPGEEFEYLSGNTQLLGMVISKATGRSLSEYLSENFWKPMGMRNNALWQLDSRESGLEKAYCCIASNARDFAKIGKLYNDFGQWEGKQLLDSAYVAKSIRPRFAESPYYGYGFWLTEFRGKEIFYMRGILGQYVIVVPEDDLIIVRLGHERGPKKEGKHHPEDLYGYLNESYKMLDQVGRS
ncbi:MAG TPA: serine hydrolase [Salinimicrobium sp.]|nr:serine hydrolase [Salinimicrobium sp.]